MWEGTGWLRWSVALLSACFTLGAYVDAWAQQTPGRPLGPWQDAPVDVGWLAVMGVLGLVLGRNLASGRTWRAALPAGYHVAFVGGLLFGLGGLADVYYQLALGMPQGLEALLSPPHVTELVGGALLVSALLGQALRDRPERVGWPVVLSASLTLSALTFATQFAHPLVDLWASRQQPPPVPAWVGQNLGVASILIQVSLLTGIALLLIRSFAVPIGSLTVIFGLNGVCLVVVSRRPELLPVPLVTALTGDVLLLWLRPDRDSITALRAFSATLPAVYVTLYVAAVALLEGGTVWSAQLWAGVALAAALAGLLVSYVAGIRRPRSVVAAEVWGDRWPQRHVEVSPARVKEALDALDDPATLAGSPLTRLRCLGRGEAGPTAELRGLLVDVMHEVAGANAPRDAEAGRLLVDYYVRKAGSHELIAERLHLSRPTFYRRLQRGLTLVAERLDELTEFAARHG